MTGLSFPVICGVVLISQVLFFTPVLPSVTPDLDFELRYDDSTNKDSFLYDSEPSEKPLSRVRRQVTVPPTVEALVPDKGLLNKGSNVNSPSATITKKPIVDNKLSQAVQSVSPTPSTNEDIAPVPANSNNSNDTTQNGSAAGGFPQGEIDFDGDTSYPHQPDNTTYYQQRNVNVTKVDTTKYYNITHDPDGVRKYWVDMETNPYATKHDMLSSAHRRAATVKPKFPILFYGHQIPNLTVATGGFIYLGDQVHAWLAATQYVAPLMANFDSSTSSNATVKFANADDYFTVEWNQVRLQDTPQEKPFTFQTTLFRNGTIVFVYKSIPIPIREINDTNHPVKVGLSDAYIKDKNMLFVRQKTIYEYDRVDLKNHPKANITSGSAIIFTPFMTCQQLSNCQECVLARIQFKCAWCPTTNRCSNGTDRFSQDWTQKGCDKPNGNYTEFPHCARRIDPSSTYTVNGNKDHDTNFEPPSHHSPDIAGPSVRKIQEPDGMSAAGVIGVMFLMMCIFGGVGWLAYAYFFPHSPSGQMLIRYRPSQWAFRRGEARYTAASIHM